MDASAKGSHSSTIAVEPGFGRMLVEAPCRVEAGRCKGEGLQGAAFSTFRSPVAAGFPFGAAADCNEVLLAALLIPIAFCVAGMGAGGVEERTTGSCTLCFLGRGIILSAHTHTHT